MKDMATKATATLTAVGVVLLTPTLAPAQASGIPGRAFPGIVQSCAVELLRELPDWKAKMSWGRDDSIKYREQLDRLMVLDTPSLRRALAEYLGDLNEKDAGATMHRMKTAVALIPYAFAVPESEYVNGLGPLLIFDEFAYNEKHEISALWPWMVKPGGELYLRGTLGGYRGSWPPNMLGWFDAYEKRFGRRKVG